MLKSNNLSKANLIEIIQIIDLDGCFISENYFIENKNLTKEESPMHTSLNLTTRNKEATVELFKKKSTLIKTYMKYTKLLNVSYKLVFFSLNLENAFGYGYNNSKERKKDISRELSNKFKDFDCFKKEICKIYTSWEDVIKATNSLKPGSNIKDLLKENK